MSNDYDSDEIFSPSKEVLDTVLVTEGQYNELYARSMEDPEGFWGEMAGRIDWFSDPTVVKNTSYEGEVDIKWYEDGILNASYNCIDRHLPQKASDVAFICEADEADEVRKVTFAELKCEVSKLANGLKELGVQKGDRVIIYMPMVVEACYAMLACARIGAVHSVVFGGFSPEALRGRIEDCAARIVITADEGKRGGKTIPLKANVDAALAGYDAFDHVVTLRRTGGDIGWTDKRDIWWDELVERQSDECPCEEMSAEDPLFILYTSGSTGTPKGVLHTTGGYMVYASLTHEVIFDYKPGDVYWCAADVGWVTGHSYIVYGPLANGATSVVYEGVPNYPNWSRLWDIVDAHQVNVLYTAPTVVRSLLREGDEHVTKTDRKSLRILGSVGEPINYEAWLWYYNVVGEKRCPIVDTWWQTETGGVLLTPLASHDLKPGAASKPFFGVRPEIVDVDGNVLEGECEGMLCMGDSWPGQMRTVFGDHERFKQTYFSQFKGKYFSGDGARRDKDGYYWITGRADDVINVSGHRLGTAEIESAINEHCDVAESAVVGFPHEIKGQGIYTYVILRQGADADDQMKKDIIKTVRKIIGPIATPDQVQFTNGLPKTRSGKIMRRILRKIAANEFEDLGDTSTLTDPAILTDLIENR